MKADCPFVCEDSTYAQAVAAGCNLVQAKATGEPCRIRISGGKAKVTGYNGAPRIAFDVENTSMNCVLYGAIFAKGRFPNPFILIIDCFIVDGQDVTDQTYRERFAHAKSQLAFTSHPMLRLVSNYPIEQAASLWEHLDPVYSNGLVYRRSTDKIDAILLISRKYPEMPGGLP